MRVSDTLWNSLLSLKDKSANESLIGWTFDGVIFNELLSLTELNKDTTALLLKSEVFNDSNSVFSKFKNIQIPFESLSLFVSTPINDDTLLALQNYWPLSVLSHLNTDLPHIFIHSAISLDGYLATPTGHSQWIGNDENLIHAHRLRALSDAVLVGGNTVIKDKPSLNVRHVKGDNPKRLILSNKCEDLSSLKKITDCKTYLLRDLEYNYDDSTNHFDKIIFFEGASKKEKILDILTKCKKENISSILVEGGGSTLSSFIETKFAKVIQFHLSPFLFGDGIKGVINHLT